MCPSQSFRFRKIIRLCRTMLDFFYKIRFYFPKHKESCAIFFFTSIRAISSMCRVCLSNHPLAQLYGMRVSAGYYPLDNLFLFDSIFHFSLFVSDSLWDVSFGSTPCFPFYICRKIQFSTCKTFSFCKRFSAQKYSDREDDRYLRKKLLPLNFPPSKHSDDSSLPEEPDLLETKFYQNHDHKSSIITIITSLFSVVISISRANQH